VGHWGRELLRIFRRHLPELVVAEEVVLAEEVVVLAEEVVAEVVEEAVVVEVVKQRSVNWEDLRWFLRCNL
jgi:hypothetical protein